MLENDLVHFYYQFHHEQHYFLCHDILEEAWKMQHAFSKQDAVVSLILLATGSYHYRRSNYKGAHKTFNKAYQIIVDYSEETLATLGLIRQAYLNILTQLIDDTAQEIPFSPIQLPLTEAMIEKIMSQFPNFQVTDAVVETPVILHHHQLRDRSDVIAAREAAIEKRRK
ncbi:DUF309 domain-containing protein [Staphylococcus intermedius]|uniref:Cytosolic protein n=1 Tax=Staphylococcus intermedius NCTC 11048 TaxID=1141106 RepID=A0A380G6L9_STAIN|nr:DUF309 domain-containing protein [Staphylococcus intermedius]PCF64867.1 hypothetical protein B5C04_02130 [Staphylococcus intermedius]PCF80477.1 hypothetical protein B4W74_02145 [Staphylococcus intermedius]PCF81827.1 hypothetical protein B4W70_02130 [Staphylococcus intermedius]PCF88164.1 hypothetical protein B4W75_05175 [Staphylococcus intermedius]PCF88878.1 hypothetical protein B4W76_01170 [Staphylococcus intermedius]